MPEYAELVADGVEYVRAFELLLYLFIVLRVAYFLIDIAVDLLED